MSTVIEPITTTLFISLIIIITNMPTLIHHIKPKKGKETPFLILIGFLIAFVTSRLLVYGGDRFGIRNLYLTVKGVHIHHFSYGILLLAISNLYLLLYPKNEKNTVRFSLLYGIALGLAFDEFGMWIDLEANAYWSRSSYDAIIFISLLLLNIIYFSGFWHRWGLRFKRLIKIILFLN